MSENSNDSEQTIWEMWFILSIVLFLGLVLLYICCKPESLSTIHIELTSISFVNLVYCVKVGIKN